MNSGTKNQDDLDRFIEEVGIILEHAGLPRTAGRVFGYLILSPTDEVSTDELLQNLDASRGSISTSTRLLIQNDLIDRVGRKGERQDYFRVKADTWSRLLKKRMEQIMDVHRVFERGLALVSPDSGPPYQRLLSIHEFYHFMEKEFATILSRWEEHKAKSTH